MGEIFDVAVVGGGNAGLCAALEASEAGARTIVLERAPRPLRGGNSRHTRNLRCAHDGPDGALTGSYSADEFFEDIVRVTGGRTDERLARLVVRESAGCPAWMRRQGARFQPALRGTLHLSRTNAFFLGGGKALMNSYYAAAARRGVGVRYEADVLTLDPGRRGGCEVRYRERGRDATLRARAVVAACGGFEANLEWLGEIWGAAAQNFVVRGTPYNTGTMLKHLLEAGAEPVGDPTECHAIAVDARAPKFDGGIVTRLDSIPLGIVVNARGERFYDEGEDLWPRRYAIWGRLIAGQPSQIAYSIVDAKVIDKFMPSVFPPVEAATIHELAIRLGLDAARLEATVAAFNRAVRPGSFDHLTLDDCRTAGLTPDKTHWAQALDAPPFRAYPLRPGITFTYLGVKVDESARVLGRGGRPVPGLFAAGEIMAGNVLGRGYVAGIGMTIGTVFGRIAGREAARHALA